MYFCLIFLCSYVFVTHLFHIYYSYLLQIKKYTRIQFNAKQNKTNHLDRSTRERQIL